MPAHETPEFRMVHCKKEGRGEARCAEPCELCFHSGAPADAPAVGVPDHEVARQMARHIAEAGAQRLADREAARSIDRELADELDETLGDGEWKLVMQLVSRALLSRSGQSAPMTEESARELVARLQPSECVALSQALARAVVFGPSAALGSGETREPSAWGVMNVRTREVVDAQISDREAERLTGVFFEMGEGVDEYERVPLYTHPAPRERHGRVSEAFDPAAFVSAWCSRNLVVLDAAEQSFARDIALAAYNRAALRAETP